MQCEVRQLSAVFGQVEIYYIGICMIESRKYSWSLDFKVGYIIHSQPTNNATVSNIDQYKKNYNALQKASAIVLTEKKVTIGTQIM